MLRRLKMALPLLFAFLLTLMPFVLLEITQYQRKNVQKDRQVYFWEQQANNYLQLFSTLWKYEHQLQRRMQGLCRNQAGEILNSSNPKIALEQAIRKRYPKDFLPESIYAIRVDKTNNRIKQFSGEFYAKSKRTVFKRILAELASEQELTSAQRGRIDRFIKGALGEDINLALLKEFRRGQICHVQFDGVRKNLIWNLIEDEGQKIVFFCFFVPDKISEVESVKIAQKILASKIDTVFSAFVPVEEAGAEAKIIFDDRLSARQKSLVYELLRSSDQTLLSRSELLPIGTSDEIRNQYIIREFVDVDFPYELWLFRDAYQAEKTISSVVIYALRIFFFALWTLVFIKVLLTSRPLGISIENWLKLIFMIIGIVPLLVLYIAGSLYIESSAFRQEQQTVRDTIRLFEEADLSGEGVLSEYRDLCRTIEQQPFWKKAMLQWDPAQWKSAMKKLKEIFDQHDLSLSSCVIFPPPVSELEPLLMHYHRSLESRDTGLVELLQDMVFQTYYAIDPGLTNNQTYDFPFVGGIESQEILRIFMGNRGDSDIMVMGEERQFFYQNYILQDGIPRNWYLFRKNLTDPFEKYLLKKVQDWNKASEEVLFSLARITQNSTKIVNPDKSLNSKDYNLIVRHASDLIELSGQTNARLFSHNKQNMVLVYPCQKSGDFILTAVIRFRGLKQMLFYKELLMGIILILLSIPVFLTSRFITDYIVQPLKKVESGLKKVALEDFSSRISLKRQDELGKLSDAFDEMVLGIIERKSLGKFVAAGLDERVARFSSQSTPRLEKNFAAVLCSDIRSFTTLSEKHEIREIVQMLNAHLTKISEKIIANNGFVEQFVGDAVLAVFFGDTEREAVTNSVKAALEINRAHKVLVKERVSQNKFSYQIGVGIDAGLLVSGEVQFDDKSEYVMLGQPRIKAEALEAMSKCGVSSRIICSQKVRDIADFVDFVAVKDTCYWEIKTPENEI